MKLNTISSIENADSRTSSALTGGASAFSLDMTKINTDSGIITVNSTALNVSNIGGNLKFNLFEVIPVDAQIKDHNLNLFSDDKVIDVGLGLNTNKEIQNIYPNLRLRGNILYEKLGRSYEITFDDNIKFNTVNSLEIKTDVVNRAPLDTPEDLFNFMLEEINALKSKLNLMEMKVNAK